MNKETIKKELYKQNPPASLVFIRKGVAYYEAVIKDTTDGKNLIEKNLTFSIPVNDMGDADFLAVMQGKHLIRYLIYS